MQDALVIFDTGAATHVGRVRRRNEDSFLARPETGLWAVADGMGGHDAGDVASAAVVDALRSIERPSSASELLARCEERVASANASLREIARARGAIIGTTVAVLLIYKQDYACVWSGDSRIYRVRGGEIGQLTCDHNEAEELVADGTLSRDEANAWVGRNVITRAIGIDDEPELDIETGRIEPGDTFVICSDGLTGHVRDREILNCVRDSDAQRACDALVALTLERGAVDNVTVVVVQCRRDGAAKGSTIVRPGGGRRDLWG
jgi:serine/threonine protein phosphatase PrpC